MEGKHSQSTKRWMKKEKQLIRDGDTQKHKDGHTRRQMGLREGWQMWQCVCVCLCALVSLCSSWASAERQHRGQLKWGVEIKGSAEACSLCIQSPLSPTSQPACWSSRSERSHAPCHSHTPVPRLHTPAVMKCDFNFTININTITLYRFYYYITIISFLGCLSVLWNILHDWSSLHLQCNWKKIKRCGKNRAFSLILKQPIKPQRIEITELNTVVQVGD